MKNLALLASGIDAAPLLAKLDANPALWAEITDRQDHPLSPHGDTDAIFLRWCAGRDVRSAFTDLESVFYPAWYALVAEVRPLVDAMLDATAGTKLGRVMIVNLKPGGRIPWHADEGDYADHFERFHLCLRSEPDNVFHVANIDKTEAEWAHMQPGELWWFNHKRQHRVANSSGAPRLHLIADIVAPRWRRERDAPDIEAVA